MSLKNIYTLFASAVVLCACNSGGTSSSGSTATYVYISDFNGNKLLQCSVNTTNGQLIDCQNIAQPNTLNAPTGIAINAGQIYVNNSAFNEGPQSVQSSFVQCLLKGGTSTLSGCLVNSPTGITNPIGFTINGNYAYIANYFGGPNYVKPGTYTLCSILPATGNLINCSTNAIENLPSTGTPEVVTINNNTTLGNSVAYVTDQFDDGYMYCSNVDSESGGLNNCQFESLEMGSGNVEPRGPRQMIINNGYAYFADSGSHGGGTLQLQSAYTLCSVSPVDGRLSACSTQQTYPGELNSPTGIAVNGSYIYITNEIGPAGESTGYSYTMCTIGESGFLTNCNNLIPEGIANPTTSGTYLTYIAFSTTNS